MHGRDRGPLRPALDRFSYSNNRSRSGHLSHPLLAAVPEYVEAFGRFRKLLTFEYILANRSHFLGIRFIGG
jgi:hypothetical protein